MKGTVVFLSSVHWNFTWQRHQNLASGLAREGYDVIFVEPLPKRWPAPRELRRVFGRVAGRPEPGSCRHPVARGVRLINPLLLPDVGTIARWINRTVFVPGIARRIASAGGQSPLIVLNSLPTRASLALQRALRADLKIYDCCWDWSQDPYSEGLDRIEAELADEVALILTDSPVNTERMQRLHSRVVPLAHGVDPELFEAAARPSGSDEPVCTYFGDLGPSIDIDLLREVSRRHRLDLIGPVRTPLNEFSERTRVVGPVPHSELPRLLGESSVLLLPYRDAPHTRGILPAKIMECFATGKPTVAIGLPSLEAFGELLYSSRDREHFLRNIERAATENAALGEARRQHARENTWAHRIAELDGILRGALE